MREWKIDFKGKKVCALILAASLAIPALPQGPRTAEAASAVWDGSAKEQPGQKGGVYQIGNGAELAWFADYVNSESEKEQSLVDADAVLTEDIDLGGQEWTPIGNTSYVVYTYSGTFDGQNHTVSGLKIDATAANFGLFGTVNTGTIKNLRVEGTVKSTRGVGGIIGKLQAGTVENCSMAGSVESTGSSTTGYAGGIIGTQGATQGATIKGCCNSAAVTGSYAGGIIGYNTKTADISSCYNTGDITGPIRSGGIAGQQQKGSISYCYSIGTSTNGICGFSSASITNCYYLASRTQDATSASGGTAGDYYETITDSNTLLQNLNAGGEGLFCADTGGINGGYPVLCWQLASEAVSVPVTEVQLQGEGKTGTTLTARALGAEGAVATNVKYQWEASEDGQTFSAIKGQTRAAFAIPDKAEYAGQYIRARAAGEDGSSAVSEAVGPIEKSEALLKKENSENVKQAKAALSLDKTVIREAGDLGLPAALNGCEIRWTSSRPDVISDEGIVTLPTENVVSVTLTATISCGTASDTKKFSVEVWAADADADVYLQKVLDSLKWDFKLLQPVYGEDTNILVKFQNLLKKKGYDGVAVTVQSTSEESLIDKNGKITYPLIPETGSYATGKQVQVFFTLTAGGSSVTYPTSNIWALTVPWNTEKVGQSLKERADAALTEEALAGDNGSLSTVVSDLTLPSCLEGDKYSFAWINWMSSDEKHLSISDENRRGSADALYNPYVGAVHADREQHTVTLTAQIQNPSTDITITKIFDVTILPMSAEEQEQTLETMQKILDCYTPDKLKDFTTKKQLDAGAVKNDIQLVIPAEALTDGEREEMGYGPYWDYWNYRFTVSSSDTDVIEINSFRAYVYRPLGETPEADRQVTLTVRLESKINPDFYVTKEIPVTVAHLSRNEINGALDLMDKAKTEYVRGLLGDNADAYSLIDNLTPYREIVWNEDKSDVDFIYRQADLTNSGVIVDELPGWEDQEDWRLFKSSDRELLANETLILNKTPSEDTFVKINSVLTDETYGKYYTKFQGSGTYDAEALARFRQLYKQPVSAYVMAVGSGHYTPEFAATPTALKAQNYQTKLTSFKRSLDTPISVHFTLLGRDGDVIIPRTQEDSFVRGATVFDVFKKILGEHDIPWQAKGSYVTSINGLSEYADGDNSGWMYTVGGVYVNSYMNGQELLGGEEIIIKYVRDYTKENIPEMNKEPESTDEPESTEKPEATEEPESTGEPEATDRPEATDKPEVTQNPQTTGAPGVTQEPHATDRPEATQGPQATEAPEITQRPGSTGTPAASVSSGTVKNAKKSVKKSGKKAAKKKKIKKLKCTKRRKNTKVIKGKTIKRAKITVRAGGRKYTVRANKNGRFTVRLKKKLKRGMKIRITVSRKGYRKRTKTFRV